MRHAVALLTVLVSATSLAQATPEQAALYQRMLSQCPTLPQASQALCYQNAQKALSGAQRPGYGSSPLYSPGGVGTIPDWQMRQGDPAFQESELARKRRLELNERRRESDDSRNKAFEEYNRQQRARQP